MLSSDISRTSFPTVFQIVSCSGRVPVMPPTHRRSGTATKTADHHLSELDAGHF